MLSTTFSSCVCVVLCGSPKPDLPEQLMTLSCQQLFVIDDCFETQPRTHISCVVDEKKW